MNGCIIIIVLSNSHNVELNLKQKQPHFTGRHKYYYFHYPLMYKSLFNQRFASHLKKIHVVNNNKLLTIQLKINTGLNNEI